MPGVKTGMSNDAGHFCSHYLNSIPGMTSGHVAGASAGKHFTAKTADILGKSTTLLGVNNPMKVINKSEFQTHKLGNVCIQQVT